MPEVTSIVSLGRVLVAFGLMLFVMLTGSAPAAASTIKAVEVQGNRRITADTVRSHVLLSAGQPYDAARADQSVKALFATGHFSDVRIDRRGPKLVVTVVENSTVGTSRSRATARSPAIRSNASCS